LQLHFGKLDKIKGFSDPEAQDALEKVLAENKITYEFFRYDADHGFSNETNPTNYNKECADLAHKRTVEFFKKYLY
jgi:carboxymethylenebutenolidase